MIIANERTFRWAVGDKVLAPQLTREDGETVTIRMRDTIRMCSGGWTVAYLVRDDSGDEWLCGEGELEDVHVHKWSALVNHIGSRFCVSDADCDAIILPSGEVLDNGWPDWHDDEVSE